MGERDQRGAGGAGGDANDEPVRGEVVDPLDADALGVPARMGDRLPPTVPILVSPLGPVFPGMMSAIPLLDPRSEAALDQAEPFVGVVAISGEMGGRGEGRPTLDQLYPVGCVARAVRPTELPDGTKGIVVAGVRRMRVRQFVDFDRLVIGRVEYPDETVDNPRVVEALTQRLIASFKELATTSPEIPDAVAELVDRVREPGPLADFAAVNLGPDAAARQQILREFVIDERLRAAMLLVEKQLDLAKLGARLQDEIRSKIEARQKEHYLREQMQAIRRELGEEVDQRELDREQYLEKIAAARMPELADERARKELDRLSLLPPEASESHVIRNYLDWLVELPWSSLSEERIDVKRARRILDEDHHGLAEVKERIVEFLAVRKLRTEQLGAILCLVGPPGVGKTSLGRSVARATGREYHRASLGGMRDEAEIKGHRRTYVGAMPGKIIQGLRRIGTRNPVFILDEIDKLGSDWRGDPSSAMLEVLDPAQNGEFEDHYLDLPFDLGQVMFIATANVESEIPAPLRDRMEIIRLSGYIPSEKAAIGRRYLLPRQLEAHGLVKTQLAIPARAMNAIVDGYTREAGVRELERMIGRVCRKRAAQLAELDDPADAEPLTLHPELLPDYLGPRRFTSEVVRRCRIPGVVTGLAWTPFGGEVLFIEATSFPGGGRLQLTGKLGDVMNESARIALSLVKSRAERFGVPPEMLRERDIHLHVPAGAVPKDGPSAGVAMTCALLSLLWRGKGRATRARVAMTGEITLRGAVLPVGGIKEKVIGAKRAGVKTVVLPRRNEPDVQEIPARIARGLTFVFVDQIDEAVEAVIGPLPGAR